MAAEISSIRQIVTSSTGRRVLLAAFERLVSIRDLETGSLVGPFDTTLDFGGNRAALSDEVEVILAGAFYDDGIAGYSSLTGDLSWRRKDLRQVQTITLSRDGRFAYCGFDERPMQKLVVATGETVANLRGARQRYESPFDPVSLVVGNRRVWLCDDAGMKLHSVEFDSFAVLDVAFAPGIAAFSEAGGPVRCVDVPSGATRWVFPFETGTHALRIAYQAATQGFALVSARFARGGAKRLVYIDAHTGALGESAEISGLLHTFAKSGSVLVSSDGTGPDAVICSSVDAPRST